MRLNKIKQDRADFNALKAMFKIQNILKKYNSALEIDDKGKILVTALTKDNMSGTFYTSSRYIRDKYA